MFDLRRKLIVTLRTTYVPQTGLVVLHSMGSILPD